MTFQYNPLTGQLDLVSSSGGSSGGGGGSGELVCTIMYNKNPITLSTANCPLNGTPRLSIPFPAEDQWTIVDPANLKPFSWPEENVCYIKHPSTLESPLFTFFFAPPLGYQSQYTVQFNWNGTLPSGVVNINSYNMNSNGVLFNYPFLATSTLIGVNQITYACGQSGGNSYPTGTIPPQGILFYYAMQLPVKNN